MVSTVVRSENMTPRPVFERFEPGPGLRVYSFFFYSLPMTFVGEWEEKYRSQQVTEPYQNISRSLNRFKSEVDDHFHGFGLFTLDLTVESQR